MNLPLRLLILLVGITFFGFVFRFLFVRHIEERNALIWILGMFLICLLSIFPYSVDFIAKILGVDYPPTLMFLIGMVVILMLLMYQSVQISILQKHVKELAELLALREHEANVMKAFEQINQNQRGKEPYKE